MNALCKLCEINLVAVNEIQLTGLMLSHVLQKHSSEEKYIPQLKKIAQLMEEDFVISFDEQKELKR